MIIHKDLMQVFRNTMLNVTEASMAQAKVSHPTELWQRYARDRVGFAPTVHPGDIMLDHDIQTCSWTVTYYPLTAEAELPNGKRIVVKHMGESVVAYKEPMPVVMLTKSDIGPSEPLPEPKILHKFAYNDIERVWLFR